MKEKDHTGKVVADGSMDQVDLILPNSSGTASDRNIQCVFWFDGHTLRRLFVRHVVVSSDGFEERVDCTS